MRDGDTYQVCCSCGTEFLERSMRQVAACLFMCLRCFDMDASDEHPDDDEPRTEEGRDE